MLKSDKLSKGKKPLVIIVAALLLAAVAGLAIIRFTSSEFTFTTKTNPLNVKVELSQETASSEISTQGGSVRLKDDKGDDISLNLGKDSLFETTKISLTAIKSIGGMDQEWKFVTGTQISPDGTKLLNQGKLKIKLPSDLKHENLMGFSYAADGKDFYFYPIEITGDTAVFELNGFSGYGIINVGAVDVPPPPPPSTIQKQAMQYIAQIVGNGKINMKNKVDGTEADVKRRIENILRGWYNTSVKPHIAEAQNNPDVVVGAIIEFKTWRIYAQKAGLEDVFSTEIEDSLNGLARAVLHGVDKATETCVKDKDPSQISKLLYFFKVVVAYRWLEGHQGLSSSAIADRILELAHFELKIKDRIRTKYPEYSEDMFYADLFGEGSVPIKPDETRLVSDDGDIMLAGEGEFHLNKLHTHINIPNNIPVTDVPSAIAFGFIKLVNGDRDDSFNESYRINVLPAKLVMSSGAKEVALSLDIAFAGGEDHLWLDAFTKCHASERQGGVFYISGWEVPGTGAVFARKSYSRTTQIEGIDIKEDTTLELVFTPKN